MTEYPCDCCQTCGVKSAGGGEDVVLYLARPFDSFHHWKHMACFESETRAAEREACASIADAFSKVAGANGHAAEQAAATEIAAMIRAGNKVEYREPVEDLYREVEK